MCREVMEGGEWNMDERGYEESCVHAVCLILLEILTDSVPFSESTPGRAAKFVCDGGVPSIDGLSGVDARLYEIISGGVVESGGGGMRWEELESLVRGYAEEVMGGERVTDEEIDPEDGEMVVEDESEVVEE